MTIAGVAFVIEPRHHSAIEYVLENVDKHIPDNWQIWWFHGPRTEALSIIQDMKYDWRHKTVCKPLPVDNFTTEEYSEYMMRPEFWSQFPVENLLVFQTDSVFLSRSPHVLEEFMDYDYVGAPISAHDELWDMQVGNGGFSFRKKSAMLKVLRFAPPSSQDKKVEDLYFCRKGRHMINIAPYSVAAKFAMQQRTKEPYPMAIHKIWAFKNVYFERNVYFFEEGHELAAFFRNK